jgi:predicted SnoaL-like aldol condensation-catalyzing enzyme
MASAERNRANLIRFYEEVINQGHVAVVDELMTPDFVHHGETLFPRIEGSEAIKAGVLGVINAYPTATRRLKTRSPKAMWSSVCCPGAEPIGAHS